MPSPRSHSRLALTLGGISLCASLGVGIALAAAGTYSDTREQKALAPVPVVVPAPAPVQAAPPPAPAIVVPEQKVVVDVEPMVEPARPEKVARKKARRAKKIDFGELDGY